MDEPIIASLGTRHQRVAISPFFDPRETKLSPDEAAVFLAIGRTPQLGELLAQVPLDEKRIIAALNVLRVRGVIVKAAAPAGPVAAEAMAEEVALGEAVKTQLLELEARLDTADHFTLLGVPLGADAVTAKAAFFKLSLLLHPDRYFRKNLGSFRPRIEKVFKALSKAHQALTDPLKREAYLVANPGLRKPNEVEGPKRKPGQRISWQQKNLPESPPNVVAPRGLDPKKTHE